MENFSFKSSDKTSTIQYYIWRPADEVHRKQPVAILQIIISLRYGTREYPGMETEQALLLSALKIQFLHYS